MHTNQLVTFSLFAALAACGSDGTTPTASGVFPAQGFTGRTLRVEISGDATTWKDGATVSFGDNVTVNSVEVASPTDLFAEITVDPAAALGKRDVTVSSGGTFTLTQAFDLVSPIELQFTGAVAQGSLPGFKIINHDFDNPFDVTTASDQNGNTVYPHLVIAGPSGVDFQSPLVSGAFAASAYQISGFALVDVDATPGGITVTSGASGSEVISKRDGVMVTARTATPLSATPAAGMIANESDSALFSLAAASGSPELARFSLAVTDPNAQPTIAVLGASGHWSDFVGAGLPYTLLPTADSLYAVVFDGGSAAGYSVNVAGTADVLTTAAEGNDTTNANAAGALAATALPFGQVNAKMTSATDVDYVKFVVPAGSPMIGKKFHVTTLLGPDPSTNVAIDVRQNDTTSISGGPQDADSFSCGFLGQCGIDFTTSAIPAAGTYDFKVTAGASYAKADNQYLLVFWVE